MTLEPVHSRLFLLKFMNPEKQRIAIAEACGWVIEKVWDGSLIGKPKNEQGPMDDLPDYLHDLNAMHQAEKILTFEQQTDYMYILATTDTLSIPPTQFTLNEGWYLTHATSAQRAEAFLKTLNLWDNNK